MNSQDKPRVATTVLIDYRESTPQTELKKKKIEFYFYLTSFQTNNVSVIEPGFENKTLLIYIIFIFASKILFLCFHSLLFCFVLLTFLIQPTRLECCRAPWCPVADWSVPPTYSTLLDKRLKVPAVEPRSVYTPSTVMENWKIVKTRTSLKI